MLWIIAALTLAQVAQGVELDAGEKATLEFEPRRRSPWVAIDSAPWQDPTAEEFEEFELSTDSARSLLANKRRRKNRNRRSGGKPAVFAEQAEMTQVLNQVSKPSGFSGGTFSGDATYYEDGTIGACSMNTKPSGYRTVAVNSAQWDNGALCGTCIEGSYTENGNDQYFKAIINNLCPECSHGDLDFRRDGVGSGDGRWPLSWKIIECPSGGAMKVTRENGNAYYAKLKVEGGPGPVTSMNCDGQNGQKTSDAFFEFQHGGSFCGKDSVGCSVTFSSGSSASVSVSKSELGGFC